MRNIIRSSILLVLGMAPLWASGVAIVDAENGDYLRLLSNSVEVTVENQVSVVVATNRFLNDTGVPVTVRYAYPMPGGASATNLIWKVNNVTYAANIEPTEQDTLGGSGTDVDPNLLAYIGDEPLFFRIEQTVLPDSILEVHLHYVQLLPYEFGEVTFYCPNDYTLIQDEVLWAEQRLDFTLNSERSIDAINCPSHAEAVVNNDGHLATVYFERWEALADTDFGVVYELNLDELGLFGFSTFLPDSVIPDDGDRGFLAFIAEPDPSASSQVLDKVFTLILDRSGSMYGSRIQQARDAAAFIVENLNEGDQFNITAFSSDVESFAEDHVAFSADTEEDALLFIQGLDAGGMTNISGAFDEVIPQFVGSGPETANIIIFFTDGSPTAGITGTEELVAHVGNLVTTNEVNLNLFCFGIGDYTNEQLLTQLAMNHNGIAEFLGDDELEVRITEFYLRIRNPVILSTVLGFAPDIITEVFPDPLPSLYQGQQLVVVGRYPTPDELTISLSGISFGNPVEYNYPYALATIPEDGYSFLPKFWAKRKIENLMIQYNALDPDSPEAGVIQDEIIELSIQFGVITPFTSFIGGHVTATEEESEIALGESDHFRLLGNYPNPFNGRTSIRIAVDQPLHRLVKVRIYNSLGQLVRELQVWISGRGIYEVQWDGLTAAGEPAPSDQYLYIVDIGNVLLSGRMTLIK